eukprot:9775922-Alexandrium_andersonii.AAC.1
MARPGVESGIGHMCRFGMTAPAATRAGSGPASAAARDLPAREPTRWMSSAPEILKRVCLRCGNEGLDSGGP